MDKLYVIADHLSCAILILKGNVPAGKSYPSFGFVYEGESPMYYEDTGTATYERYEYTVRSKDQ